MTSENLILSEAFYLRKGKKAIRIILDFINLVIGLIVFSINKRTPKFGHQALIALFCKTGGRSNDFLSKMITLKSSTFLIRDRKSHFGSFSEGKVADYVKNIAEDGFHLFNFKIPEAACNEIYDYTLRTPATVRGLKDVQSIYNPKCPEGVRYDYSMTDVINLAPVQELVMDPLLLNVAANYLGSPPTLDVIGMWWHTDFSRDPDEEAAQFYHFDMDRIKWLKFFFYITDVDYDQGPHCFIRGTHLSGRIPKSLLEKGYARHSDSLVKRYFSEESEVIYCGDRGTFFAEDTRGLHKGETVKKGGRLVLQIQFSNSLFGANYKKPILKKAIPGFREFISDHPRIFQGLDIQLT